MTHRRPRDRQRGNSLLLALIVMSALATLGSLTVVSVQSSLKASTNDRFQAVALYAAESGAAAAMDYLRHHYYLTGNFPALPDNTPPVFGNNIAAGVAGNPFSNDQQASYSVVLTQAPDDDPGHPNTRVLIRSTGYGAQGSTAILEWEIAWDWKWWSAWAAWAATQPPPGPTPPTTRPDDHGLIVVGWRQINL